MEHHTALKMAQALKAILKPACERIETAGWGVVFALRTGPGDFNKLLVTNVRFGGACPAGRKVAGGRVWDISALPEGAAGLPPNRFLAKHNDKARVIPTLTEEISLRRWASPACPRRSGRCGRSGKSCDRARYPEG